MPQIRLHARIARSGDLTAIAYCRQAQARILVREGHAEWQGNKLVLRDNNDTGTFDALYRLYQKGSLDINVILRLMVARGGAKLSH